MNNNMGNPNIIGSGNPGSPSVPAPDQNQGAPAGQTQATGGANDTSKAYDELQQRLGQQGQELGEYRTFFQSIAPLLDKLDQSPELVQAIVDGKIDKEIAKAVLENRVDVKDAVVVQQAHDDVKTKMGDKAYKTATPEEITKLVESQVNKVRREIEEKSDLDKFQDYTQNFIEKTPDFQEYADEIDKWLDSHDAITDIEVAYYAVKGKLSESSARKAADEAATERAKEIMSNAQGGGQTSRQTVNDASTVDKLISGQPNPNSFFGSF